MNIPINLDKKLGDKQIELIREKLNSLSWLNSVYPAVKIGKRENGDTYPQLYAQNGKRKILDLIPSTKEKSYCFFEKRDYEIANEQGELNSYNLTLTFWGQLNIVDETLDYDFTDNLISDVINILQSFEVENMIISRETFGNFNLHESNKQFFMSPYFTFEIKFTIKSNNC